MSEFIINFFVEALASIDFFTDIFLMYKFLIGKHIFWFTIAL